MEELRTGAFRQCIELINAGEVFEARAILTHYVVFKDPDNPAAWALMAHLVDDRAEEIHCLEQVVRLQPDNHYARYRLISIRNHRTTREKPLKTPTRPFRFSEHENWWGDVDLSSSWFMPQGRRSRFSKRFLGWGIIPDIQAAWPTGLKFRTIMTPFSEEVAQRTRPLRLSRAFRGVIDKLLLLVIFSALTLLL